MELFILEDYIVKPHPEALLIPEFRDIWMRDTSPGKEVALKELTYIEFMCSPKKTNPFWGYDEGVRGEKVKEKVFKDTPFMADNAIALAMEVYKEFLMNASPTLSLLESARKSMESMKDFLNTVNVSECNARTGTPLYKPRDITSAVNDLSDTVKNLDFLQKRVEQEIFETTKVKGGGQVNPLEV